MEEIRCEIRLSEDRAEGEPARLVGILLMPFNTEARASDRPELFETWQLVMGPESGIVLNRRATQPIKQPIHANFYPFKSEEGA